MHLPVNSEFLQQDSKKKRMAKRLCVTNVTGLFLEHFLWWSSLIVKIICPGLLQKDLFKGGWSSADKFFKQNYCHPCHTRFAVFLPLPSCCISSLIITWRGGGLSGQIHSDKNFLCWLKELDQLNRIWPSFSACSRCCHSSLLLKQKIYMSYM